MDKWELAAKNWETIKKIAPKVTEGRDGPDQMADGELAITGESLDRHDSVSELWSDGTLGDRGTTDGLRWIRFDGVQEMKGDRRIESLFVIENGSGSVVLTQW